jgi:hypothetical protein
MLLLLLCAPLVLAQPVRHRAAGHPSQVPIAKHVFVVILENTDARLAENLPFVTRLAARGAILRNAHCITHPSQPNYLAVAAGSTLGITGSEPLSLDGLHLGDLAEGKGLSWKVYAEQFPGACYLGETSGAVADGQYVRRHVPFLSFLNIQQNPARCLTHVVNAGNFDADLAAGNLPNLSIYIPDNLHNGHDSNAFIADAWMESRFGSLLDDPRFMDQMLFIITYDESSSPSDLRITTVLFGSMVRVGAESSDSYNHYDLLRTIETVLGLGTLGRFDNYAHPVTGVWR